MKTVPWATVEAPDELTYESQYDPLERTPDEQERMKMLRQLGYL